MQSLHLNNAYMGSLVSFQFMIYLLGLATEEAPDKSGAVASLVMCVSGIGGASVPVMMGFFADILGIRYSFGFLVILAAAGLLAGILFLRFDKNLKRC